MSRFGAFAIHLGISLVIFLILGYLILYHWYPDFFFASDGGWQGIRIVAFVDFVLGPTLTLVVFNPKKPRRELKRDLTIIGSIQAICLAAGTFVVYSERPIAMVFADGSFQSMTADDYLEAGQPVPSFAHLGDGPPYWVSVVLPKDLEEQSRIRRELLQSGQPLKTAASYYQPFDTSHIINTPDLPDAEAFRPAVREQLSAFADSQGLAIEDYLFLPFGTRYAPAVLAFRKTDEQLFFIELPLQRQTVDTGR